MIPIHSINCHCVWVWHKAQSRKQDRRKPWPDGAYSLRPKTDKMKGRQLHAIIIDCGKCSEGNQQGAKMKTMGQLGSILDLVVREDESEV